MKATSLKTIKTDEKRHSCILTARTFMLCVGREIRTMQFKLTMGSFDREGGSEVGTGGGASVGCDRESLRRKVRLGGNKFLQFPFCLRVSDELLATRGRGVRSLVSHCPTLKATTDA